MASTPTTANPVLRLNDGASIPVLGLGVYQTRPGEATVAACLEALRVGYRHIDTAQAYGNERDVGAAIQRNGLPRSDVFVTTKIANGNHGTAATRTSLERSLKQFGYDYFDLVLVHFPVPGRRSETWRALVQAQRAGLARSIGVSNYTVRHLSALLAESDVVPAVNQVELSPFCSQAALRTFCAQHAIVVEAYSPLTQGLKLRDVELVEIAHRLHRTPAQILLRWGVQQGLVLLPKSVTPARIAENAALFDFELGPAELDVLDALDENFRTCWDPTDVQ